MKLNIRSLSLSQLERTMQQLAQRKERLQRQRAKDVRAEIDGLLKKAGLTLADVFPRFSVTRGRAAAAKSESAAKTTRRRRRGKRAAAKKTVNPAKYRNPVNPSQTWTGRGKRPQWFIDAQKRGKEKELLIRGAA